MVHIKWLTMYLCYLLGRRHLLKCLLEAHSLLMDCESRYILNDLYVTDYCVWIQSARYVKTVSLTKVDIYTARKTVIPPPPLSPPPPPPPPHTHTHTQNAVLGGEYCFQSVRNSIILKFHHTIHISRFCSVTLVALARFCSNFLHTLTISHCTFCREIDAGKTQF